MPFDESLSKDDLYAMLGQYQTWLNAARAREANALGALELVSTDIEFETLHTVTKSAVLDVLEGER